MTLAAIVLADQRSATTDSSSGQPLLLEIFRGQPLVLAALGAARSAELDETIVVTGATDLSGVLPAGVTEVHNNRWAEGRATSLQAGLAAASWEGHSAAVVGWADQPLIPASAWIAVASADAPIVFATFEGRRSWPVLLQSGIWTMLAHAGDDPVSVLAQEHPDMVAEVACPGDPRSFRSSTELAEWT